MPVYNLAFLNEVLSSLLNSGELSNILSELLNENVDTNPKTTKQDKTPRKSDWIRKDNSYVRTIITSGINPHDIKLQFSGDKLHLTGKSNFDGFEYGVDKLFSYPSDLDKSNIKDIKFKSLNGLTYVYINMVDPKKVSPIVIERF